MLLTITNKYYRIFMSTSKRVIIRPTPTLVTKTLHNIIPTRSLTPSYSTNTFSLHSTPVPSLIPSILPTQNNHTRITIVAILSSCGVIFLIATFLVLILCCIGRKIKSRNLKKYSNFPKEEHIFVEKETEYTSEENSKYNPIYVSGDSIRGREDYFDTQGILQEDFHSIRPGLEVEAIQDYYQPGREKDKPIFFKRDRILVLQVEGDSRKDPAMTWIRGEINGREVFFPSYVVRLVDTLEDTFDTFTTPVRGVRRASHLGSFITQDSVVSVDSAPAELESLFHDVDYTLAPHSNVIPLLPRDLHQQRHSSHSDIYHKPVKRPIRRPPMPPVAQPLHPIPSVPSKLNRPKLSSKKRGSKDTNELVFVPPPLSSSTPVKQKTPPKQTKRLRPFMPRRQRRPDTPNAKVGHEYKLAPLIRTSNVPSWIQPMDSVEVPLRPEPPYTPSTLSLLLSAGSQEDLPDKPPPPILFEPTEPDLGKAS